MLEELFKLLNNAKEESDDEKKLSLYEEYSKKLAKLLEDPKISEKYIKSDLEKLSSLHSAVQEEVKAKFKSFKKDMKNFQEIKNGINAYNSMLRSITTRNLKKG